MIWRSVWAVFAGVLFIIVVTTIVDVLLHVTGVYPAMNQPMTDTLALLATAYRIVISIGGGWLTAKLAPVAPMKHALMRLGLTSGELRLPLVPVRPETAAAIEQTLDRIGITTPARSGR